MTDYILTDKERNAHYFNCAWNKFLHLNTPEIGDDSVSISDNDCVVLKYIFKLIDGKFVRKTILKHIEVKPRNFGFSTMKYNGCGFGQMCSLDIYDRIFTVYNCSDIEPDIEAYVYMVYGDTTFENVRICNITNNTEFTFKNTSDIIKWIQLKTDESRWTKSKYTEWIKTEY